MIDVSPIKARLYSLSPQVLVAIERISPAAYKLITKDMPRLLAAVSAAGALAERERVLYAPIAAVMREHLEEQKVATVTNKGEATVYVGGVPLAPGESV